MNSLEKELPNAPDAERAIVGALLINPEQARDTIPNLRVADFNNPIHRSILSAMGEMLDAGDEIDQVMLAEHLRDKGDVHDPLAMIHDLTRGIPLNSRLDRYVEQVREKARLRALVKSAGNLIARINDGGETSEEIAQTASAIFDELAQEAGGSAPPLITSYAEFMHRQFADGESLAFHAGRGEVTVIQSVTNHGKSTLVRNAALTLAAGGKFLTVVERSDPRKVLLFNFEGAGARFQRDLEVMTRDFTGAEMELVRANLFPVHDPAISGESLTLPRHMALLQAQARRVEPDIVIIDTASAAFQIKSENDNAEIQGVMKGLIRLARKLNCLVILTHHIGKAKAEEGKTREAAHRGRGASAWSDFATTIFNLEADADDRDLVFLECAKRKDGETYELVLRLDRESRWFSVSEEEVRSKKPTNYDLVVSTIKDFERNVQRAEIDEALAGKISGSTITRRLKEALDKGDVEQVEYGVYRLSERCSDAQSL